MMLSAIGKYGNVLAWEVTKADGAFYCPMCHEEVIVKKGQVKTHHFAHIPPSDCAYGIGESEEHRKAKVEIYETLKQSPDVTKLQLERPLGNVRPDISFCFKGWYIAIEVQISTLSLDTIDKRTKAYASKGIYLLWTSPHNPYLNLTVYSPRLWEKYIHTLYFGKVYYWLSDVTLLPVHFDKYLLHVEERSWWEGEGHDAEEVFVGGYDRTSKRFRTPQLLNKVNITDLAPITRKAWTSKDISIPAARLWA